MTSSIVELARVFALAAHAAVGQVRKYTNEPYICHPAEVAAIVASVPDVTDEMIAAAWLHDVVEDTGVKIETIREVFGPYVAELVGWLTDVSQPSDGNRKVRKAIDRKHSAAAPSEVQTIKYADLISNTKSIVAHDLEFAVVYLKEKQLLLQVMNKGNDVLYAECKRLLREGLDTLKKAS